MPLLLVSVSVLRHDWGLIALSPVSEVASLGSSAMASAILLSTIASASLYEIPSRLAFPVIYSSRVIWTNRPELKASSTDRDVSVGASAAKTAAGIAARRSARANTAVKMGLNFFMYASLNHQW